MVPIKVLSEHFLHFLVIFIHIHLQYNLSSTATQKNTKIGFQYRLSLNAGHKYCRLLQGEHSAILLIFIKLPFCIKTFVLYVFEWPLKTGFTVLYNEFSDTSICLFQGLRLIGFYGQGFAEYAGFSLDLPEADLSISFSTTQRNALLLLAKDINGDVSKSFSCSILASGDFRHLHVFNLYKQYEPRTGPTECPDLDANCLTL